MTPPERSTAPLTHVWSTLHARSGGLDRFGAVLAGNQVNFDVRKINISIDAGGASPAHVTSCTYRITCVMRRDMNVGDAYADYRLFCLPDDEHPYAFLDWCADRGYIDITETRVIADVAWDDELVSRRARGPSR